MRRLFMIAAFALFLVVPVWAQRGGGHAGGGHAGGFGGHAGFGGHNGFGGHTSGFSGGHGGGHFSGGMHHSPGLSRGFSHGSQRGFSSRGFHRHGPIISNFRSNRRCWNCRRGGWGFPWWYSGYYDPYWWWDHGSSYDEDYERDRALAEQMNAQSLEEQRMLHEEEANRDEDAYARPPAQGSLAPDPPKGAALMPATVLVFRDQHRQEVENYAIVGQTLWNFAPQHTQKIALADLDLQATAKANDDRGVAFRIPAANEAQ